jgi:hypothetical protein
VVCTTLRQSTLHADLNPCLLVLKAHKFSVNDNIAVYYTYCAFALLLSVVEMVDLNHGLVFKFCH